MTVGIAMRRNVLPLFAATTFIVAMAGCSRGPAVLPPDPPGVQPAKDDAFGNAVRTADREAQKAVADQLASRFGKDLRVLPRSVDSDAEPGPIKAHYEEALAGAQGWREFPLGEDKTAWSFAYTSPDGRSVVAVVVLNPRFAPPGGGNVPLSILTNLGDDGDRR